jgi:hypothetical protein
MCPIGRMKTPSVFISYRRSDAEGWAGRLSDSLRAHLGQVRIFRDIEDIPPGVDFIEYFTKAVGECDALIEIIGPDWLTVADASGRRRLDDPNDPIRLEVVAAIRRNIRVIPVLLEGATMPKAEDLPDDLQPLARRNAYPLSDSRWADDTKKLAGILRAFVQPTCGNLRTILTAVGVVAAVVIGTALYQSLHRAPSRVNMDDPIVTMTTVNAPLTVLSPVRVEWSGGRNRAVQVYENGDIVFPPGPRSAHEENPSGVTIQLQPGVYEVKTWYGKDSFKAAWIEVRGR